jgi:outer membrane biosynthesis protein TonB
MGRAMLETFAVVKSTHPLFTTAVRKAVREMRFEPAVVDGKKVPQKVQSPFTFEQERITR